MTGACCTNPQRKGRSLARSRPFGPGGPGEPSLDAVAVIGLGRFGRSLALELMANGTEVLGIDRRHDVVQDLDGQLTYVVTADATSEAAMRQLSVPEFSRAVVAVSTDIAVSVLVTSLLIRFKVPWIWAEALGEPHGAILEQLGVHRVVYPEQEMGRRVAHLVRGTMQDYIHIGGGFAVVETEPHAQIVGRPLDLEDIRSRYGVAVTALRRPGEPWTFITPGTVPSADDLLLVTGPWRKAEAFSQLR